MFFHVLYRGIHNFVVHMDNNGDMHISFEREPIMSFAELTSPFLWRGVW